MKESEQPESGLTKYEYDSSGNLLKRTDARTTVTTWLPYDALNRPTGKSYSGEKKADGTAIIAGTGEATPTVSYGYDGGGLKGALSSVGNASEGNKTVTELHYKYDKLGRVIANTQTTNNVPYAIGYSYNLANQMKSITLPSMRTIQYTGDEIGRTTGVFGIKGLTTTVYATGVSYEASGGWKQMQLGNGLQERRTEDSRQRRKTINLGTAAIPDSILGLTNNWDNNGNLASQAIKAPGMELLQSYTYDSQNRLDVVTEKQGTTTLWSQDNNYDAYDNRTVPGSPDTPASYNPLTNQASTGMWAHDAAGNQTKDGLGFAYEYDAEGRVRQTGTVNYAYDGEGRRVRKFTMSGEVIVEQVIYVYDASGQLAGEYPSTKPPESSPCFGNAAIGGGTLCYLTADHLGTTRVVTNASGGVVSRMDFKPFGEQIAVVGGTPRVNVAGYSADSGVSLKFTGQVRDASMQDYFGARYFSGYQGRFTSPDEALLDQNPEDPQSWNLYSYVRNNPLIFVDPSGNDCVYLNSGGFDVGTIDSKNSPAQCGKTGGYWVDGTVTNATFAHGSLSLTGTTNGENRTSASYALGADPGMLVLREAGNRASRDLSTILVAGGVFATAYVSTYAAPAVLAGLVAMGETGAVGPGTQYVRRLSEIVRELNQEAQA